MANRDMINVRADESHDFEKNPVCSGFLRQVERNKGEYNSTALTIEKEDGRRVTVWANKILEEQILTLPVNTYISIEYLGLKKAKKGGKEYKDYSVSFDRSTMPSGSTNSAGEQLPF